MTYKFPYWYTFKKLDLKAITDDQLKRALDDVNAIGADNLKRHDAHIRMRDRIYSDACEIWGVDSQEAKFIKRRAIPAVPDLPKIYREFENAVMAARKAEADKEKRRAQGQRYRDRKRQEFHDQVDSLILEGASENDMRNPEFYPESGWQDVTF